MTDWHFGQVIDSTVQRYLTAFDALASAGPSERRRNDILST
jgi:hypothetical protein